MEDRLGDKEDEEEKKTKESLMLRRHTYSHNDTHLDTHMHGSRLLKYNKTHDTRYRQMS